MNLPQYVAFPCFCSVNFFVRLSPRLRMLKRWLSINNFSSNLVGDVVEWVEAQLVMRMIARCNRTKETLLSFGKGTLRQCHPLVVDNFVPTVQARINIQNIRVPYEVKASKILCLQYIPDKNPPPFPSCTYQWIAFHTTIR